MNILLEPLPEKIEIEGKSWNLRTDFRNGIRFELAMLEPESSDTEKLMRGLEIFYPDIPTNLDAAVERVLWFYRAGEEIQSKSGAPGRVKRTYDFELDSEYIYAAFLSQYHIDLSRDDLHWWRYLALFKSLSEDNEIVKIMGYRSVVIDSNMSREQKEFYGRMKKKYELPAAVSKDEQQKISAIEAALLGDGNVSKVL